MQLSSFVEKYSKIWKLKPCKSSDICTLFYNERKSVLLSGNVVMLFAHGNRNFYNRIFSTLNNILQPWKLLNCSKILEALSKFAKIVCKFKSMSNWEMIDFLTPCTYVFHFMRIWRITFSNFTGIRLFFLEKELSMEFINNSFYSALQIPLPFLNLIHRLCANRQHSQENFIRSCIF